MNRRPSYNLRENSLTAVACVLYTYMGVMRRCLSLSIKGMRGRCSAPQIHLLSKTMRIEEGTDIFRGVYTEILWGGPNPLQEKFLQYWI